jgi:hypothetical protein
MSVRLPTRKNSVPTWRIFMKICICVLFEILERKFKFNKNLRGMLVTLHEDLYACLITPRSVSFSNRNLSQKFVEKIKYFFYAQNIFPNKPNIETRSGNHYCSGVSSKCYISWVCVFSIGYPKCNMHEPYFHLWRPAVPYCSTLSNKRYDFQKKI